LQYRFKSKFGIELKKETVMDMETMIGLIDFIENNESKLNFEDIDITTNNKTLKVKYPGRVKRIKSLVSISSCIDVELARRLNLQLVLLLQQLVKQKCHIIYLILN